ncbi:arylamine N-acetyltransferase, pineal gland isozyme NAT-3-like [Oculina patagonica]
MERDQLTPDEVKEYLARIHYTGPIEPTIEVLSELQRCHILSVPFENLSVFGKEKIILSKDWLFDKIVRKHRGGFCYELNTIYSLLLDFFGFSRKLHAGTVFSRNQSERKGMPFDHMILMINIEDALWLTDVVATILTPLRFKMTDPQEKESGIYRIRKEGEDYFIDENLKEIVDEFGREEQKGTSLDELAASEASQRAFTGYDEWAPRCKFDLIPRTTEDFNEMLNYHQTNPESPFTHDRICTIATPSGRITLAGNKVVTSTYLGENKVRKVTKELLGGEEEIVKELEQNFGIRKEACLYPEGSLFYRD